ncbi:uncharacterized protein LOC111127440 [Crassostrea virginica]
MAPINITGLIIILAISCVEGQTQTKEGVEIEIITPPPSLECQGIRKGDWVSILYNASTVEGQYLDSTYNRGRDNSTIPEMYYFAVGTKNGVTIGLEGACKGEQRRLKMPLSKWQKDANDTTIVYDALVRDHVPVENKHRLMEFWSLDWSSDGFVDLEEIDGALNRDKNMKAMLEDSFGVEGMSDMLMNMFDRDGDESLDRDEFFLMHEAIHPEKAEVPMEEEDPKEQAGKKDRRRRPQKVEL